MKSKHLIVDGMAAFACLLLFDRREVSADTVQARQACARCSAQQETSRRTGPRQGDERVQILAAGAEVEAHYIDGNIRIAIAARALKSGRRGDIIKIVLGDQKKQLDAKIEDMANVVIVNP